LPKQHCRSHQPGQTHRRTDHHPSHHPHLAHRLTSSPPRTLASRTTRVYHKNLGRITGPHPAHASPGHFRNKNRERQRVPSRAQL
jgi:hypothetical protein